MKSSQAALFCRRALLLLLLGVVATMTRTSAADADPLQDFCVGLSPGEEITLNGLPCKPADAVQSKDFASPLLEKAGNFQGNLGSAVNLAMAGNFGALNTQGLSIARIDFKPGGLNPPHVHPRATEVLFLAQGTLLVGFVTTAPNNTFFYQTIHTGDLFVFPRGLVHFQLNLDNSQMALAISALNSQNPGTSQLAVDLFAANPPLPSEVLEKTFGIDDSQLQSLIKSVAPTLP